MVQVLPPKYNVGDQIGQSLQKGLEKGSDIGFQRGMLQNALKGLENISDETSQGELASKVIMALSGTGAEKFAPQLFQSLSQDIASKQAAKREIEEATQRQNQGFERGQTSSQNSIPGTSLSHEDLQGFLGEKFFPNIQVQPVIGSPESLKPQKPLMPPSPIGPGEEAKIRNRLIANGITNKDVIDKTIEDTKNYQKDFYNSQKEGFSNVEQYQQARQERDNNFFQGADSKLGEAHGTMTPAEQSIWKELSREYEDLPDSERFANTEQLYNTLVGNPVIQFESNQKGLPWGSYFRPEEIKNRMEDARTSVKDHLRRIDEREDLSPNTKSLIKNQLRDQYFNSMGAKDYGIAQAAYAVSDLNPETARSLPKAPPPKVMGVGGFADTIYLGDGKEREKYTYSLANSLANIHPDDSLILLREKALQNNYDDKAFNQALNLAINSGKLKLSDFQAQERNKLSIPQRLDMDSVMEGTRSLFDIFKGKK